MTPANERTCTECRQVKPMAVFVPIKGTLTGVYGRCKSCRARRQREHYHADPDWRAREIARVQRNQHRRSELKQAASVDTLSRDVPAQVAPETPPGATAVPTVKELRAAIGLSRERFEEAYELLGRDPPLGLAVQRHGGRAAPGDRARGVLVRRAAPE